jgi:hypothetical protein
MTKRQRKLKQMDGMDPQLLTAMEQLLERDPTVADGQALQMAMLSQALQSMVQIRLAQWIEAALETLRDEFGFTEHQLAHFAQEFMEKTRGETTDASA